jgi:heterodisulfide reductase subunit A
VQKIKKIFYLFLRQTATLRIEWFCLLRARQQASLILFPRGLYQAEERRGPMEKVLIIGGGLAGCVVARELSRAGISSCILEKESALGGKARTYGCKATDTCSDCGVCLTGSLWSETESDEQIDKLYGARLLDLFREKDGFTAVIERGSGRVPMRFSHIVVASGFAFLPEADSGNLEIIPSGRILSGPVIEKLIKSRGEETLFETAPERVGFLLCFGSRNTALHAPYCSKVCCAYSTRAAKVVRRLYPEAEVVLFYMDLQAVKPGRYADELRAQGIDLIRCRPAAVRMENGRPAVSWGDNEGYHSKTFDYIVLCSGIRPGADAGTLAELCSLQLDGNGFLRYVRPPRETGIWLAGTASGPMTIAETVADAKNTAALLIKAAAPEVLAV